MPPSNTPGCAPGSQCQHEGTIAVVKNQLDRLLSYHEQDKNRQDDLARTLNEYRLTQEKMVLTQKNDIERLVAMEGERADRLNNLARLFERLKNDFDVVRPLPATIQSIEERVVDHCERIRGLETIRKAFYVVVISIPTLVGLVYTLWLIFIYFHERGAATAVTP